MEEVLGFTCLIALNAVEEIMEEPLRAAFQALSPRSSLAVLGHLDSDNAAGAMIVDVDGHSVSAVTFPHRIPRDEFSLAVEKSLFWRTADVEMSPHTAFIALSATEKFKTHGLARAQAVAVTRLAAAFCQTMPALGVYWLSARTMSSPEGMIRAVDGLERGYWPVNVWLGWFGHGSFGGDSSVVGFQTLGADEFLGFELYCEAFETTDVRQPLRLLYSTTGYLMDNGNVIPDGQIINVVGERRTEYKLLLRPDGRPGVARIRVLERDYHKLN